MRERRGKVRDAVALCACVSPCSWLHSPIRFHVYFVQNADGIDMGSLFSLDKLVASSNDDYDEVCLNPVTAQVSIAVCECLGLLLPIRTADG